MSAAKTNARVNAIALMRASEPTLRARARYGEYGDKHDDSDDRDLRTIRMPILQHGQRLSHQSDPDRIFAKIVAPIIAASAHQSDRAKCSLSILISANQIMTETLMTAENCGLDKDCTSIWSDYIEAVSAEVAKRRQECRDGDVSSQSA